MHIFLLPFFLITFLSHAMDNDLPIKKLNLDRFKKAVSLSQLTPRSDFLHLISLIKNNCPTLAVRRISKIIAKQKDKNGDTALHHAARHGHYVLIKFLVINSANVNDKNNNGNTPLHLAALHGQTATVRTLLKLGHHKPNVNSANRINNTALHFATLHGHDQIIRMLLLAYASPEIKNDTGETAKDITHKKEIKKKFPKLKNIEFKQQTLNDGLRRKTNFNFLIKAIQQNDKNVMNYIKKVPMNDSDSSGNTPLHIALSLRHYEIAKILLKHNADPNKRNHLGETPLHRLVANKPSDKKTKKECIEIIKILIKHKVDLSIKNNMKATALDLAKLYEDEDIINALQGKSSKRKSRKKTPPQKRKTPLIIELEKKLKKRTKQQDKPQKKPYNSDSNESE